MPEASHRGAPDPTRNRFSKMRKKYRARARIPRINSQVGFFKLRGKANVTTNVGGALDFTVSDTNGNAWFNGATALQDWTSAGALYDQYRICAVKLKYFPYAPNDLIAVRPYTPLYVIYDPDDTIALTSVATAVEYENMKAYNLMYPFTHYQKCVKSMDGSQTDIVVGRLGFHDVGNPVSIGAIKVWAESLAVSASYGILVATYYVKYAHRR